ncbi:PREDICTED: uncharacterized protein LOC104763013 [Camelina sativa]|uniref:Uncharacterized protein LOC104763013 n=1 Tax=Camelina sativa TaxID=90675 RepID=A0ABM0XEI9_CAMSA|nr:PREDICTED: uncharacterized protein LOC104763013 [Camelina sativa]
MPPKKIQQQNRDEQTSAFREVFTEFSQDLRQIMQDSVANTVRAVLQAQAQARPIQPNRNDPVFDADSEGDDDNPFAGGNQQHGNQQRALGDVLGGENHRWESGFRLDLPEFSGSLKPEEFLDWLSATEELLDFKSVPGDKRVPLVATRFRGRASAWWQQLKVQRVNSGKSRVDSWDKLKKHMRRYFLPYNYARTVYTQFQNLRQGTRSVDEYSSEFFSLLARNSLYEAEEHSVSRFIGGLKQQIQNQLLLFNPTSISEAHQRAVLIEQNLRPTPAWSSSTPRFRSVTNGEASHAIKTEQPALSPAQDVSNTTSTMKPIRSLTFKCFNCGETGHRQASCPKRVLFGEEEVIYDEKLSRIPVLL